MDIKLKSVLLLLLMEGLFDITFPEKTLNDLELKPYLICQSFDDVDKLTNGNDAEKCDASKKYLNCLNDKGHEETLQHACTERAKNCDFGGICKGVERVPAKVPMLTSSEKKNRGVPGQHFSANLVGVILILTKTLALLS